MHVRVSRLVPTLALTVLAACHSDSSGPHFYEPPIPASLLVGDLVKVNVNGEDACTNPTYHVARVEAIGDKAMILADTLNPPNGFTPAQYQSYAAKFDTLIYPLDEGAFGAPTDIDKNGRVGIIFTRAVNELTPANANSYVGGFTYSRDLFPVVANDRAEACAASNQGEFFYALAPDPTGVVNGNKRSTAFVDSATVPVLAHELQHLINASRRLYVNTTTEEFEDKWLDEGLAHIAEELLFYRESGTAPRSNLDVAAIQARAKIVRAFNSDMIGNTSRYHSYLVATSTNSPYAGNDSLSTRGAAWNWLRYLADQKMAGVTRNPSAAISLTGTGSVSVPGGTTGAEYYATLVNSTQAEDQTTSYGITASSVVPPVGALIPIGGATLSRTASLSPVLESGDATLKLDQRFEARLRASERALAPRMSAARGWYAEIRELPEMPQGRRYSVSAAPITSPDGDIWFRLVNTAATGLTNLQQVFGVDPSVAVSDWSASHAVDDVSTLVNEQFTQKSWNFHSIYPALQTPYPLQVTVMANGTPYSGTILSGGSRHFRLAVAPAGTATITVTSPAPTGLRLLVVRTK
jgi:hypothetical protein